MVIKTKYKFGDILYLKVDPEQYEYMIIGIIQEPGNLSFRLRGRDGEVLEAYDFELSDSKDELKTMGLKKQEDGE